jgi:hypothetical protein
MVFWVVIPCILVGISEVLACTIFRISEALSAFLRNFKYGIPLTNHYIQILNVKGLIFHNCRIVS